MYKIFYNPLSRNGKSNEIVDIITSKLNKENKEYVVLNILEIEDADKLINSLNTKDEVIFLGGDGTIHHLANKICDYLKEGKIKNKLYLYRGGSGNDFSRDAKKNIKNNLLYLNDYLSDLPKVEFNDNFRYFVNGVGLGVDALICKKVNASKNKKGGSYLKHVVSSLKEFKKTAVKVNVDGKEHVFKKALLATVMYGRYLGGGMKFAPKQKRGSDELSLLVINNIPTWFLALVLPTVFLGWHTIFPCVHVIKGKHIEATFEDEKDLQLDGEVEENVKSIKAYK